MGARAPTRAYLAPPEGQREGHLAAAAVSGDGHLCDVRAHAAGSQLMTAAAALISSVVTGPDVVYSCDCDRVVRCGPLFLPAVSLSIPSPSYACNIIHTHKKKIKIGVLVLAKIRPTN